jgi:hypothetical protein
MASVPHHLDGSQRMIAADHRLSGKTTVYSPALNLSVPTAPLSLAGIALTPLMAVIWLVMVAVSVVMLAVMLVVDAGAFLARGGRPNPAQAKRRRIVLMPSLF